MKTANQQASRLIASAARATLGPLGCTRIGRSRIWLSDQRFWAIIIEFQPCQHVVGSFLNVAACWFWYAKDYWSFDIGGRIQGRHLFEDEHQFGAVAEKLATRAAEEVRSLRDRFASMSDIARELYPTPDAQAWRLYHAAVAAGLAGETASAEGYFNRLLAEPPSFDWHKALQGASAKLARNIYDTGTFRDNVLEIIQEARIRHGLAPDPTCLLGV